MDNEKNENKWLDWAIRLQALAQNGLAYTTNIYDIERFEEIRNIAAEMVSFKSQVPLDKVKNLFFCEEGYQTPKLDTRAAIVKDDKILLVQENDGLWSMPGGWVDVNKTIGENAVKEVFEEAGLKATARRIIAIQDRDKHNPPRFIYKICKIFVLCDVKGGEFHKNSETVNSGYFGLDSLPPLSTSKTTASQIDMCIKASRDENWQVVFD